MTVYPWHQPLWQQFVNLWQQQRLAHAILMSGAKGLAKTDLALNMAKFSLCLAPSISAACGQCHSCELFAADAHPDHLLIEPEEAGKTIKIDQIRALKDKQSLTANISAWKTVVVHPAHKMTANASNSLLKLLEEPQPQTLLILVSSQPQQLPVTIRSRCQLWPMLSPAPAEIERWLKEQGIKISEKQLHQLTPIAKGAPLMLQQMLESRLDLLVEQLQSDMQKLMQGNANPMQMQINWQQNDLLTVMHILQYDLRNRLIKQPEALEAGILWQILDCIQITIKLVSSSNNYNKTLLIEDFMVSVMRICRSSQTIKPPLSRVSL
ncbi:MAG: DNA polymerase III subunit delta' [Methylophaga sp.]|nr:DNA polymerase III subunit delta' [Methylophaga sp.]